MPAAEHITYQHLGPKTLLLEWPRRIDPQILKAILRLLSVLEKHPIAGIEEWHSAYSSIAISFNPTVVTARELQQKIKTLKDQKVPPRMIRKWSVPVYYDPSVAPDLEAYCQTKNLSIEEVIALHTFPTYEVFFIGFLPGFMYLGGLDPKLFLDRKAQPARSIPTGSVAIGGEQTGIYPNQSPGGWHVLGNCPVSFFDPKHSQPCLIEAGDHLVFSSVRKNQFEEIKKQVENDDFSLKPEVIDG